MKAFFIIFGFVCFLSSTAVASSFLNKANEGSSQLFERLNDEQSKAQEKARQNRDSSKDVCYQLTPGSDAQTACFGKYPHSVKNERARNILLGNCFSMGSSTELSNDLSYVCERGPSACVVFDDGDAGYWCKKCGATRTWLAVYSLGPIIQCFD